MLFPLRKIANKYHFFCTLHILNFISLSSLSIITFISDRKSNNFLYLQVFARDGRNKRYFLFFNQFIELHFLFSVRFDVSGPEIKFKALKEIVHFINTDSFRKNDISLVKLVSDSIV